MQGNKQHLHSVYLHTASAGEKMCSDLRINRSLNKASAGNVGIHLLPLNEQQLHWLYALLHPAKGYVTRVCIVYTHTTLLTILTVSLIV